MPLALGSNASDEEAVSPSLTEEEEEGGEGEGELGGFKSTNLNMHLPSIHIDDRIHGTIND